MVACSATGAESPAPGSAASSPRALAESLYAAGTWDSAAALFSTHLEAAQAVGDAAGEAIALTWLGLVAYRKGEYEQATRLGREALDLKRRIGLDRELFTSYNALGLVAWQESRYVDAVSNFEQATAVAESAGDSVNLTKAWNNLALVLIEFGDYARARELLERALPVVRRRADRLQEGRILANLGMLAVRTGQADQSFGQLRDARLLAAASGDYSNELNVLGQLASAHGAVGEPGTAIAYLDSALVLSRDPERGSPLDEQSTLALLGEMYAAAGDHRRALRSYGESIALDDSLGLPHERGADLRAVAAIHAVAGDHAEAERAATEALATHRALGTRLEVLWDLLVLAELVHSRGRPHEARTFLDEARSTAARLGSPAAAVAVALTEARLADREGRAREVLRHLARLPDVTSGDREWEVHHLRMRANRRLGRRDDALREGRRALESVERIRGDYGAATLRTAYLVDRAAVFGDVVDLLVEAGRLEEALAIADASRGRAVVEHLAARRDGSGPTARELAEEERQLLLQVDALAERVAELGAEGEGAADLRGEQARTRELLEQTRTAYDEVLVRAARAGPGASRAGPRLDVGAVRKVLASDEVLVEFLVTDRELFTFVLTTDTLVAVRADVTRAQLATQARIARELAGRRDAPAEAVRATYTSLGSVLLGAPGVREALSSRHRVIVVPHAELVYVPFAALIDPESGGVAGDDRTFLHLPAASMLADLRQRSTPSGRPQAVAFAPFGDLLPYSAAEAKVVQPDGHRVRRVDGRRATERAFRDALAGAGIVHAATHGTLNASNPLFSRIEFARGRGRGLATEDDGRLDVHEVLGLSTHARLVFLSGCETGVGVAGATAFDRGEDFATLSQAFLLAGAANVIATLWPVQDDAASVFASRFYAALNAQRAGPVAHGLADALAEAQRAMRRDPRYRAPYFWAGYTLSGSGTWDRGSAGITRTGAGF